MPVSINRETASIGLVNGLDNFMDCQLRKVLQPAEEDGYEFVAYYIGGKKRAKFDPTTDPKLGVKDIPEITVVDLQLKSVDWSRWVVGRISPWIDTDSDDPRIAELSIQALQDELSYCRYLDIPAAFIPLPKRKSYPNLLKILDERLWQKNGSNMLLWILAPINSTNGTDGWDDWFAFRSSLYNHQKVYVSLQMTLDMPGDSPAETEEIVRRWLGEPVSSVYLTVDLFNTGGPDGGGWLQLSPAHQKFITSLFSIVLSFKTRGRLPGSDAPAAITSPKLLVWLDKSGSSSGSGSGDRSVLGRREGVQVLIEDGSAAHRQYVNHLWETRPQMDAVARFAAGYEDHLQTPLQPLSDDLESSTYEIFEKDNTKYSEYRRAIELCLNDIIDKNPPAPGQQPDLVLMVLGAGRGPLVAKTREAVKKVGLKNVRIYAIEKNKNAIVTLKYRNQVEWNNQVTIIQSDMRDFKPEEKDKADIIISELLGSFGDNELSPECLDGAKNVMKKSCISIPAEYCNYLAPIHSPKLYCAIRDDMGRTSASISGAGVCNLSRHPKNAAALTEDGVSELFDVPYVVRLHNNYRIAPPQSLFTFRHPSHDDPDHTNARDQSLTFKASMNCELMGFGGYFDCVLYKDVKLSIHPDHHSIDMFSWFPILFPLPHPIPVTEGSSITVSMQRTVRNDKIWYEWQLTQPAQLRLQNSNGKAYSMECIN